MSLIYWPVPCCAVTFATGNNGFRPILWQNSVYLFLLAMIRCRKNIWWFLLIELSIFLYRDNQTKVYSQHIKLSFGSCSWTLDGSYLMRQFGSV